MTTEARAAAPAPRTQQAKKTIRYWVSRIIVSVVVRCYVRPRVEDRDLLPKGAAVYCFTHMSWADPFMLMAVLPYRPRLYFFGPKEEDMTVGGRNRIMGWSGAAIPYKPGKNDLLEATRRTTAVFAVGGVLAIAGEGRIHAAESELLPLNQGAAYFALRAGVPLVPIAIRGTSWLAFGRRVAVRIGEPLMTSGRPTRAAVDDLTARTRDALLRLVTGAPDVPVPGRFGRWVTEVFNDWPEGSREAAVAASAGRGGEATVGP